MAQNRAQGALAERVHGHGPKVLAAQLPEEFIREGHVLVRGVFERQVGGQQAQQLMDATCVEGKLRDRDVAAGDRVRGLGGASPTGRHAWILSTSPRGWLSLKKQRRKNQPLMSRLAA